MEIRNEEEAQRPYQLFDLQQALLLSKAELDALTARCDGEERQMRLALSQIGAWLEPPPVPCVHLHSVFTFKDPESCSNKELLLALDTLAGASLYDRDAHA